MLQLDYKLQTHVQIKHEHLTTGNVEVHKIPLNNMFWFEGLALGIQYRLTETGCHV